MKEQWILVNANATVSKQKGNRQQFRRFVVASLLHAYLEIYTEEILSRILFAYQMYLLEISIWLTTFPIIMAKECLSFSPASTKVYFVA